MDGSFSSAGGAGGGGGGGASTATGGGGGGAAGGGGATSAGAGGAAGASAGAAAAGGGAAGAAAGGGVPGAGGAAGAGAGACASAVAGTIAASAPTKRVTKESTLFICHRFLVPRCTHLGTPRTSTRSLRYRVFRKRMSGRSIGTRCRPFARNISCGVLNPCVENASRVTNMSTPATGPICHSPSSTIVRSSCGIACASLGLARRRCRQKCPWPFRTRF